MTEVADEVAANMAAVAKGWAAMGVGMVVVVAVEVGLWVPSEGGWVAAAMAAAAAMAREEEALVAVERVVGLEVAAQEVVEMEAVKVAAEEEGSVAVRAGSQQNG